MTFFHRHSFCSPLAHYSCSTNSSLGAFTLFFCLYVYSRSKFSPRRFSVQLSKVPYVKTKSVGKCFSETYLSTSEKVVKVVDGHQPENDMVAYKKISDLLKKVQSYIAKVSFIKCNYDRF